MTEPTRATPIPTQTAPHETWMAPIDNAIAILKRPDLYPAWRRREAVAQLQALATSLQSVSEWLALHECD